MKCDLAERMRLATDWGLEIVTLFEALRHRAPVRVCQVELAERYEHKHQEPLRGRPLARPAPHGPDVCKHLLRTLAAAGRHLNDGLLRACWPPTSARRRTRSRTATRSPSSTAWPSTATRRSRTSRPSRRAARLDRGVPGRPPGRAARAQLGARLGGDARRRTAAARRRAAGHGVRASPDGQRSTAPREQRAQAPRWWPPTSMAACSSPFDLPLGSRPAGAGGAGRARAAARAGQQQDPRGDGGAGARAAAGARVHHRERRRAVVPRRPGRRPPAPRGGPWLAVLAGRAPRGAGHRPGELARRRARACAASPG